MRVIYDIETLKGYFCATFYNVDSKEFHQFQIDELKDDTKKIKEYWNKITYCIGYNSIGFDNIVVNFLISNASNTSQELYEIAQDIISRQDDRDKHKYLDKYKYTNFKNVDLMLYWSKNLRMSKKLSLKSLGLNMGLQVFEMPIHHSRENLTEEEKELVKTYNQSDIMVTNSLFEQLKPQINLRISIKKDFDIECLSKDAPKIASDILINSVYKDRQARSDFYSRKFYKHDFIIGDYLPSVRFKTHFFNDLYQEVIKSKNTFQKEIVFKKFDNTYIKLSYGIGGLHTIQSNEKYFSTEEKQIYTSDVASLYPTLLINNKFIRPELSKFLDIYSKIKADRVIAKREGNKNKDEVYKLILNSFSGILDNVYSPFYSPFQITGLRILGQLLLTRLIEECNLNGFSVISANTDGIEVYVKKGRENEYLTVVSEIEKEFEVVFEHDIYKSIHYLTVNDYVAIGKKIKTKGDGTYDKSLDKSNVMLIIPLAFANYLQGVPVEKTIRECTDLEMFTTSKRVAKDYKVYFLGKQVQQLNRYYVAKRNKGGYLYKSKDGEKMHALLKDTPIIICNDTVRNKPVPDDIDYNYYINAVNERISEFYPKQISLF